MTKNFLIAVLVATLSGCAATYTLGGKRYNSSAEFQSAVEFNRKEALASINPVSKPLTAKKLIAALPSEQAIYAEFIRRATTSQGYAPRGVSVEIIENLSKSENKHIKAFYEAVAQRGIYSSVEILDMPSLAISLEASSTYDVLYYSEPAIGSGQYFYVSSKYGKQIFVFDRSSPSFGGRVKSFIEAVQVQAIRE